MANRKNILVISSFWTGVRPFFIEGKTEFKGMPAFTNTFFRLLENENIERIEVLFFGKNIETKYNIPENYKHKLKATGFSYRNPLLALFPMLFLFLKSIWLIYIKGIGLIYAHGSVSGLAGIVSIITRVPNVRRIYGTFLAKELEFNKLKIFLRHPLEYLAFSLPAKALIITNDGTKGDMVFEKIGNKKVPFHFLLNGINKNYDSILPIDLVIQKYEIHFIPEICYVARIDKWKRQHLLLEILFEAKKKGNVYSTVIAGPVINTDYYNGLKDKIVQYDLTESVMLIPGLTKQETLSLINFSKISVSFYSHSNLGNVFLESLSLGTVMFSQNIDDSLGIIDKEIYVNVNPINKESASSVLIETLSQDKVLANKALLSLNYANENLLTWEERAKMELELLGV